MITHRWESKYVVYGQVINGYSSGTLIEGNGWKFHMIYTNSLLLNPSSHSSSAAPPLPPKTRKRAQMGEITQDFMQNDVSQPRESTLTKTTLICSWNLLKSPISPLCSCTPTSSNPDESTSWRISTGIHTEWCLPTPWVSSSQICVFIYVCKCFSVHARYHP